MGKLMNKTAPGLGDAVVNEPPDIAGDTDRRLPQAGYALFLLFLVAVLCYVDRTIISAVAEDIKLEMDLTDGELGFLYGTSFSVLFALFGFPIGRLSDLLPRTRLMASGLFFWSSMTMFAGVAWNFATLAISRIGLGLGEATANPSSHSLISQYFPRKSRGRALAVYLMGTSLGSGLGLYIGGWMVQNWSEVCSSVPIDGACGLSGWRAAMLLVGAPGLFLAILIARLREPPRPHLQKSTLGALLLREFSASLPPLTIWAVSREGGPRALVSNIGRLALIAGTCTALTILTGDAAQWIGLGLGLYALVSWATMLKIRDRPLFYLTFGDPTFVLALAGFTMLACITLSIGFWAVPYAIRVLEIPPADAGLYMGLSMAVTAAFGALAGGFLVDWWRRHDLRAPLWIGIIVLIGKAPFIYVMFTTDSHTLFLWVFLIQALFGSTFSAGAAVLVQELVLVRMRGTAAASFALTILLVSLAFGPYMLGKISELTGSLGGAIMSVYALAPFALVCFWLAARRMIHETDASRLARAIAHGEPSGAT
jgi:MFS family permease